MIATVVNIFKPGNFVMTLFANEVSHNYQFTCNVPSIDKTCACYSFFIKYSPCKAIGMDSLNDTFDGYRRQDCQFCQFRLYSLLFTHYVQNT